ncbi:MAG: putative 4-hydroxybenzoate polyprenyltransferase [Planctomycetaceae bacterium]|jgi:4-hydroxybenzoate polyprenyltransferase|nr:putative 4-hydroxybenzoate polyprenyltransferase [Planctomycetaceae bacterium]
MRLYFGLIRFSHTLFALPFALLAYCMAIKLNGCEMPCRFPFRFLDISGILLCMVFARSAAMGFNRFADKDIDARNPRTANRHIPAGVLSARHVLLFVILCSLGFIGSTLLFLPNRIPLFASIPVLIFLFCYSYTKRWTVLAHFWLGAALMTAPFAAWIAVRPVLFPIPVPPVLLGLGVFFWTAGFDLIYAAQDAEFDKKNNLFSIPGRYGITAAFRISALCHFTAAAVWFLIPFFYEHFGFLYKIGIGGTAIVLAAEHLFAVPKGGVINLDRINTAFFQFNVLVSAGLLIIGIADILLH